MLIGMALGVFRAQPLAESIGSFIDLQKEFPLTACEVHLESSLYSSALRIDNQKDLQQMAVLRQQVKILGIHLPFMDFNPISPSPQQRDEARSRLHRSIRLAARVKADYIVFHGRGDHPGITPDEFYRKKALWQPVIDELAELSRQAGPVFCLENADDIRDPDEVMRLIHDSPHPVGFCLDVGHLFERVYPAAKWRRRAMFYNDHFSPVPFLWPANLPIAKYGNWPALVRSAKSQLSCIHLHNHNGRMAHQLLSNGHIDLQPLADLRSLLKEIPLVIESDYREKNIAAVKADLSFLEGILSND